ncbi:hypothetical protein AAF712_000657 [Marasmius tenuissimus]|uniref:Proteasome activator PA28 C-terminal domain-containing protein n=1 Tax=Marasmius tenuissimus TaxID=585030 RepID=A0ABR3ADW8_9AGAR
MTTSMEKHTKKEIEVAGSPLYAAPHAHRASPPQEFSKVVNERADAIIFKTFPEKVCFNFSSEGWITQTSSDPLNKLIAAQNDPETPFGRQSQTDATVYPPSSELSEPPSKKRKTSNGEGGAEDDQQGHARYFEHVKSNKHVRELHGIVKKECEVIAELIDEVKLWVTLTMPRIEDGDNFGVQVQEECLSELHRAQESAYNLRDIPRQDYVARAKLASKRIKYPNVEDYTVIYPSLQLL